MTDYVISDEVKRTLEYSDAYKMIRNYANILKQQPILGHFVPCDMEGNVLHPFDSRFSEAEERILFNGWTLGEDGFLNLEGISCLNLDSFKTIEELIIYGSIEIELTESAIKQLGL